MGAVYTQLILKERHKIESWWHAKVPVNEIAEIVATTLELSAMFLFLLTETAAFEMISAMCTVGLSMGLTGDLSDLCKIIVIILMTAGCVGILIFGIALATHDESREDETDNDLVL